MPYITFNKNFEPHSSRFFFFPTHNLIFFNKNPSTIFLFSHVNINITCFLLFIRTEIFIGMESISVLRQVFLRITSHLSLITQKDWSRCNSLVERHFELAIARWNNNETQQQRWIRGYAQIT